MTGRLTRSFLALGLALATLGLACERGAPAPPPEPVPNPPAPPAPVVAPPVVAAPARARPTFTLVYSSDLRGRMSAHVAPLDAHLPPGVGMAPLSHREEWGGLGRRATIVDRARVGSDGVVQVDAGDFLPLATDEPRDLVAPEPKDVPRWLGLVLASYRRLGVDAVTLGERELTQPGLDPKRLAKKLEAAHVPVVLANLVDHRGALVFPASALVDAGGVKVGIVGVTELDAGAVAALAKGGYTLTPAAEALRAGAKDLRAHGATFVAALVHASAGRARAAALVSGAGDLDVAVLALGHEAAGAPTAAPATGGATRPRLLAAGGDLTVGRLDVRVAGARPPDLDDAVVDLGKSVREQLGVGLLSRVARVPLIDTQKMLADAEHKHVQIKNRDLYEIWDWGSTKACGYCHPKPVAQWSTTDHAHAFATLTRVKHDKDPNCLGCHVVGFLQLGGSRDLFMLRDQFANVGCEGCHGPSAAHVRSVDKKLGTIRHVDPVTCLGCHTPDQNIGSFDPVASMKDFLVPGHGLPATKTTN